MQHAYTPPERGLLDFYFTRRPSAAVPSASAARAPSALSPVAPVVDPSGSPAGESVARATREALAARHPIELEVPSGPALGVAVEVAEAAEVARSAARRATAAARAEEAESDDARKGRDPSQREAAEPSLEQVAALVARARAIRDEVMAPGSTRKSLGAYPAFKELQAECAAQGYKVCSSFVCPHLVRPFAGFSADKKSKDGLLARCKACDNNPATTTAAQEQKLRVAATVKARVVQAPGYETENEVAALLLAALPMHGIEVRLTWEFRRPDLLIRRPSWPDGLWFCVQLKTDGVLKDDGTAKPNDSVYRQRAGGAATFKDCTGYAGMLVLFVKTRFNAEGELERTFWGTEKTLTGATQVEHLGGTLGEHRLKSEPLLDLLNAHVPEDVATLKPEYALVTKEEAFWDIPDRKQRKEVTGMCLMRLAGYTVTFPSGNQGRIDAYFALDGSSKTTQAKPHHILARSANVGCIRNGKRDSPYHADDGVDQVLIYTILRHRGATDRCWMLYALLSREALVRNGVFASAGNADADTRASPGTTTVCLPGGVFAGLLGLHEKSRRKESKWLDALEHGWRDAIELTEETCETRANVPWTHVLEAAVEVDGEMPSDAELAEHRRKLAARLVELKTGAGHNGE